MRVQATKPRAWFEVTADGEGSSARRVVLLVELADASGCQQAGPLDGPEPGRVRHRSGKVLADLAVMLADGGDCPSDLAVLRDQPGLFGLVASIPTAWRVVERLAQVGEQGWPGCGRPAHGPASGPGRRAPGWAGYW